MPHVIRYSVDKMLQRGIAGIPRVVFLAHAFNGRNAAESTAECLLDTILDSRLATSSFFLLFRLAKDFASNRIFHELPLIPPEWRGTWSQKVILRGESTGPDPSGNLFLTNMQQLYETREQT